ncbi:DNA-binding protein [candidate division KSB1 bacterium]|nr:MAG: DNA-binding protein [candidate division KSB1 bacterium]
MKKIDLVKLWIFKAEEDRKNVENNLNSEDILYGTVCFHTQQMAEKYLKGYLLYNEIDFLKTNVIEGLVSVCKEIDKDFEKIEPIIGDLSDYAVEIRYPDDWYSSSHSETMNAYNSAKK